MLSSEQLTKEFLFEATGTADSVILLQVIEPQAGFTPSELSERMEKMGSKINEARFELAKRGVRVFFYEEWGSWEEKIKSTYKREGIDEVVLPKSSMLELKGITSRRI